MGISVYAPAKPDWSTFTASRQWYWTGWILPPGLQWTHNEHLAVSADRLPAGALVDIEVTTRCLIQSGAVQTIMPFTTVVNLDSHSNAAYNWSSAYQEYRYPYTASDYFVEVLRSKATYVGKGIGVNFGPRANIGTGPPSVQMYSFRIDVTVHRANREAV